MIQPGKRRIVGFVVVSVATVAIVASFAYAFSTDSPLVLPLLLYLIGSILGVFPVYFALRSIRSRRTLAGRLVWGVGLIAVAVLGFAISVELSRMFGELDTALGGFVRGIGLSALLGLLLPLNPSPRNR